MRLSKEGSKFLVRKKKVCTLFVVIERVWYPFVLYRARFKTFNSIPQSWAK